MLGAAGKPILVRLLARGGARAVLPLLQHLADQGDAWAEIADELAGRLARRLPAE